MKPKRSAIWVVNPDVISRYKRGQSIRQIADHYGVKWSTVHNALKSADVEVGRHNKAGYRFWTDDEIKLLIDLRRKGRTLKEIAGLLARTKISVERQYQRIRAIENPENWLRRRNVWYGAAADSVARC